MDETKLEATLAVADDPGRLLADLAAQLLESTALRAPLLHHLLLYAALPRSFDAELLADLAHVDRKDPEFDASLQRLVAFPFVHERSQGGWAMHDAVRQVLSHNWRSRTEPPTDMEAQLARLADLYEVRYCAARKAVVALGLVEVVVREAGEARYAELADSVTDRLVRSAVELVHTALRQSPERGFTRMYDCFTDLEGYRLHRSCKVLARGWASDEHAVADQSRPLHRAWAAYFTARAASNRGRWADALDALDAVTHPEELDIRYATWQRSEAARALRGLSRFREALLALDDEIALHEKHHLDDGNSWVPWNEKAQVYAQLWEGSDEIRCAERAVSSADAHAQPPGQVTARLSLASSVRTNGDLEGGMKHLLDAVRLARASADSLQKAVARSMGKACTAQALSITGPRSTRVTATLVEQHRQLVSEEGADGLVDTLLLEADALADAGDRTRALATFDKLRDITDAKLSRRRWEVDAEFAGYATTLGVPTRGGELNMALLADPWSGGDPWTRARCLTNGIEGFLNAGALSRASALVDEAASLWGRLEHRNAESYLTTFRAELLRRGGDLVGARAAHAGIDTRPGRGYDGFRLATLARLDADEYRLDEACDHALGAYEIAREVGDGLEAIERGLFAVNCLVRARRLNEAAATEGQLAAMIEQLRRRLAWTPTAESALADEHAARAVRILMVGYGPVDARVRSALEHLDEALNLDDTSYWFCVEAAMAESIVDHRKQSMKRLTDAMDRTDDQPIRNAIAAVLAER